MPPVCTYFEDIDYINSKRRTVQIFDRTQKYFGGTQVEKHWLTGITLGQCITDPINGVILITEYTFTREYGKERQLPT